MYFPRSEIEEWPMAYTPRCSPVKRPRLFAPTYIEPIKSKAPQLGA
jgi:hypothetical protein